MNMWEILPSLTPMLVPMSAIIGGVVYMIMRSEHKTRIEIARGPDDKLNRLTEENIAINRQLYARLETIEQRLAGVEKLLKEIPQ
ncbi:MAG TPA: hypothetical protein VNW52_00220 [Burkholderiaceae bacterium]|jgi:hypothetical protein|nr:hypothetical protein [Burkholderiaceae bacterium]